MVSSNSLGSAVLELSTDDKELTKGLNSAKGKAEGFNVAAVAAIGGVTAALGAVGAGFGVAISSAAGFEKTMSGVSAVSGASAEELKNLSGLALQLGKDTSFSASEAAQGIEELVKGGVSIADIMGGAATASLNLAAAGGVGLADAAEIASNAMAMFDLKGSDMAMVADQIAGAANASSLSVTDFKFSLSAVGAVANLAGQSFQDTATAIAMMGASGIKGSDAGTSLKSMLMNLIPTTDKAVAAMEDLGLLSWDNNKAMQVLSDSGVKPLSQNFGDVHTALFKLITGWKEGTKVTDKQNKAFREAVTNMGVMKNSFLDAEGNFQSLESISDSLHTSLEGLSESQKQVGLEAIFGSDGIRAAAVLAKGGAESFNEMAGSMNKVTAASVAAERLNNVNGSMEQLRGSLETVAITIGLNFLPLIKQMVDGLTGIINALIPIAEQYVPLFVSALTDASVPLGALTQFFHDNEFALVALGSVVAGIAITQIPALVTAVWASVAAFGAQAVAAGTAALAMAAAALPFIAIGAVIGAVILAGYEIVKNWELISFAAETTGKLIEKTWNDAAQAVIDTWNGFVSSLTSIWNGIVDFLTDRINAIPGIFEAGWQAAKDIVTAAVNGIYDFLFSTIPYWVGYIAGWLSALPQRVGDLFKEAKDAIVEKMTAAWNWVSTEIPTWPGKIAGFLSDVGSLVGAKFDEAKTNITTALAAAWTWITENVPTWPEKIARFVASVGSLVLGKFNEAKDAIYKPLSEAWTWVSDNVPTWPQAIYDFLSSLPGLIDSALSGVLDAITEPFKEAWRIIEGIWKDIGNLLSKIGSSVTGAAQAGAAAGAGKVPGMASGGDVTRGGLAVVGEQGAELLNLPTGASVRPLATASGVGPTTVVHINGDVYGLDDLETKIGQAVKHVALGGGFYGVPGFGGN